MAQRETEDYLQLTKIAKNYSIASHNYIIIALLTNTLFCQS